MTMKGHEIYIKLLKQYAEAYRAWIDTGEKENLHRYRAIRDTVHDTLRMEYSESRTRILMNSALIGDTGNWHHVCLDDFRAIDAVNYLHIYCQRNQPTCEGCAIDDWCMKMGPWRNPAYEDIEEPEEEDYLEGVTDSDN